MNDREGGVRLLDQVYDELRRLAAAKLARERADHTLDATALVHEAYLRLEGGKGIGGRTAYLKAAAVAMQRILVDHARRKQAAKRGGAEAGRFTLKERDRAVAPLDPDDWIDLAGALDRLAAEDPTSGEVARLRLCAGLSVEETAEALGTSRASAYREWAYARSWLIAAMKRGQRE